MTATWARDGKLEMRKVEAQLELARLQQNSFLHLKLRSAKATFELDSDQIFTQRTGGYDPDSAAGKEIKKFCSTSQADYPSESVHQLQQLRGMETVNYLKIWSNKVPFHRQQQEWKVIFESY